MAHIFQSSPNCHNFHFTPFSAVTAAVTALGQSRWFNRQGQIAGERATADMLSHHL
jgi:hypothetical protein